jgi:hypothetical protein
MIITTKHLLVLLFGFFFVGISFSIAVNTFNYSPILSVFIFTQSPLVCMFSFWQIFKLFNLRPLILPICPACKNRHGNYHIPKDAWPDPHIICQKCESPLQLDLEGKSIKNVNIPCVQLKSPKFLGLWSNG